MPNPQKQNRLHLPDLAITQFRGIKRLLVPQLGQVTLIGGKNGVGKTTVLEAAQVYAARGRYRVLSQLLRKHDERASVLTEDDDDDDTHEVAPDLSALFHRRDEGRKTEISIGPRRTTRKLTIKLTIPSDEDIEELDISDLSSNDEVRWPTVGFRGKNYELPWLIFSPDSWHSNLSTSRLNAIMRRRYRRSEWPASIKCEWLGPAPQSNNILARYWDDVAATQDEGRVLEILSRVSGQKIERVIVVGDEGREFDRLSRRIMVKMEGYAKRVPLQSLGDGAVRLFGTTLALTRCRNGILLIDEAENGVHHSIQSSFWNMVLNAAEQYNVQVLATTHSWDCVAGFARAAENSKNVEGIYVRLERRESETQAISYSEENLLAVSEQRIEVR